MSIRIVIAALVFLIGSSLSVCAQVRDGDAIFPTSWIDVRQFNVDRQGVIDAGAAFAAADAAAAAAGGGIINVPAGTYKLGSNYTGNSLNQWVLNPGVTFTGAGVFTGGTGSVKIGNTSDPRLALFGNTLLKYGSTTNQSSIVSFSAASAPSGFPSSFVGLGRVTSANQSEATYYGECFLAVTGICEAMELDTFSSVAPQTVLPFNRNGTQNLPIGLTIAASTATGFTNNSAAALEIGNNGARFNYGIVIDVNGIVSSGYGIASAAPVLIGDASLTSNMLVIKGGTGTQDPAGAQIELLNTSASVTAPNKFIRINGVTSAFEIANSAYTTVLFSLTDTGALTLASWLKLPATATTGLPTCNGAAEGTILPVTDASSNTFNATFTGSSTNHMLARCNGTTWVIG